MQRDLAVECGGEPRRMRHHQETASRARDEVARKPQHLVGGVLIEIAGRLVRKQQFRFGGERAADRDALLLPARQLLGIAPQKFAKAEPLHQFRMPGRIVPVRDARLEGEIVIDRKARDQVELLEYQAEPIAPQLRASGVRQCGDVGIVEPDLAAIGGIEPGDQMQQRALARTGFARQRHALAGRHIEIDPA